MRVGFGEGKPQGSLGMAVSYFIGVWRGAPAANDFNAFFA